MKASPRIAKQHQIVSWVQNIRKSPSKVLVSNYCYTCFFTGDPLTKTLIVFPDELDTKGIISIGKPLEEIEITDIIKLYKRIKCD